MINKLKLYYSHIQIDKKFLNKLIMFKIRWMNHPGYQHIEFLSSNLFGVHRIKFEQSHLGELFYDLLEVDEDKIAKIIEEESKSNSEWETINDITYVSLTILIHMTYAADIPEKLKIAIVKELFFIISIRYITTKYAHYFKAMPLDIDIATEVYETLTRRSLLKKLGSWQALFDYQGDYLIDKSHENYARLVRFNEADLVAIIQSFANKYNSIIKELSRVMYQIIEDGTKRSTTSALGKDPEGTISIVDVENRHGEFFNYLLAIAPNKLELIKIELVEIVADLYPSVQKDNMLVTLKYISDDYLNNIKYYDKLFESILNANLRYLHVRKLYPPYDQNVYNVVKHLKGLWAGSKVNNVDVKIAKDIIREIAKKATQKKTMHVLVSLGMAISTYLFIRAVHIDKYR